MQSEQYPNQDVSFITKTVRKLIWLLKIAKHHAHLMAKKIYRLIVRIVYEDTRIKHIHQQIKLKKLLKESYGYEIQKQQSKISIALILRDGTTYPKSSAFIRLISPLSYLSKNKSVSFRIFKQNTTDLPNDFNICIVQRTAYDKIETAQKLVDNLTEHNIKLIVDTDDAFNLIDSSHSEYSLHDDSHSALELLIKNSNQVWVSTNELAKQYRDMSKSVYVIPNTLDKKIWFKNNKSKAPKGPLKIIYMGTATHDEDFKMVLKALDALAKREPNKFTLSVIGVSSKELPDRAWISRLYQPPGGAIYPKFVKWFLDQGPFDIGLCPLIESPFNNYKSDIKCLDYIAAGIQPIASNVPAYGTKGLDKHIVRINNDSTLWVSRLNTIIDDLEVFRKKSRKTMLKANSYLWTERSSEIASNSIIKLLHQALKK